MIKLKDLETFMEATKHNKNYNTKRAAWILYQHYVLDVSIAEIAAHLHITISAVYPVRNDAKNRLRKILPLLSDHQLKKLYDNDRLRRAIFLPRPIQ